MPAQDKDQRSGMEVMASDDPDLRGDTSPQTPPRRDSHDNNEPETEGPWTRSLKKPTFAVPRQPNLPSNPPHPPFLAYARRVRSYSSPFQLTKSRYLLTFADQATAQEWWRLIQLEYPDCMRESPQVYSFKSEHVPLRAWENPVFADLSGKWSFRQLEVGPEKGTPMRNGGGGGGGGSSSSNEERQDSGWGGASGKRGSGSILRHNHSMPTVRERSPEIVKEADYNPQDDPFSPRGGKAKTESLDFAQLSITSSHIKKTVSQATVNMDTLLEGQRANARDMHEMQDALERLTLQVDRLVQQQEDQDEAVRETVQSAIEQSTTQIQDLTSTDSTKQLVQSLQQDLSQTSSHLRSLVEKTTKTTEKQMKKMAAAIDQQTATQDLLMSKLEAIEREMHQVATRAATTALANQTQQGALQSQQQSSHLEEMMAAFEKRIAAQTRKSLLAQQTVLVDAVRDAAAAAAAPAPAATCNHDILPPPRKVHRKLIGYVYAPKEKGGE